MPQLEVSTEGRLGIVTLDRPEAINALSQQMIEGITAALRGWAADGAIAAVLFEGRGPRGFCAGGDVRAARQAALDGTPEIADAYFAAEYAMNLLIATYPKPVAAIGHGAVMGGGIGILSHARFSFAPPEARFAMPEAAIGFVSDVGVNAILAMVPEWRALAFLMTGLPVGAPDAVALGLCGAVVPAGRLDSVRAGIAAAVAQEDPETALVQLMQAEGIIGGEAVFCAQADGLAAEFGGPDAAGIVEAVMERAAVEQGLGPIAAALASRSPTSLAAILASHRAARRRSAVGDVLGLDLALARHLVRQPDFAEGVRAVLVDKDHRPIWQPSDYADVDLVEISEVIRQEIQTSAFAKSLRT